MGIDQGALPRLGQECHARLHGTSVGQYLPVAYAIDGTGAPIVGESGHKARSDRNKGAKNNINTAVFY